MEPLEPSCLREPVQGKGWIFQTNVAAAKADEHADTAKGIHTRTQKKKTLDTTVTQKRAKVETC